MRRVLAVPLALVASLTLAGCITITVNQSPSPSASGAASTSAEPPVTMPETVRIGVTTDRAGLSVSEAGTRSGFEVDLAAALADELGFSEVEWVDVTTSDAAARVAEGDVDLALAGVSLGSAGGLAGLAGPYLVTGLDLLVAADDDSIQGPQDLEGKNFCATTGPTSELIKGQYAPGANRLDQPGTQECVTALIAGAVDAVVGDDALLAGYSMIPGIEGKVKLVGAPFTEEEYAVVLPRDGGGCDAVNAALGRVIASGAWSEAFSAAFGDLSLGGERNPPLPGVCE